MTNWDPQWLQACACCWAKLASAILLAFKGSVRSEKLLTLNRSSMLAIVVNRRGGFGRKCVNRLMHVQIGSDGQCIVSIRVPSASNLFCYTISTLLFSLSEPHVYFKHYFDIWSVSGFVLSHMPVQSNNWYLVFPQTQRYSTPHLAYKLHLNILMKAIYRQLYCSSGLPMLCPNWLTHWLGWCELLLEILPFTLS